MPLGTLQDKDFLGRQEELTSLYERVLRADTGVAESVVVLGSRGAGKTELIKQLFGLLFWKQDHVAPFYHLVDPALLSAPTFSKAYLIQFLCQRLAFEKKEQSLFLSESVSLAGLKTLVENRDVAWAGEIIEQYLQNADDPISSLRIALAAPHRSALLTGMPVAVLIDEFHRLKGLAVDGAVDPGLVSLFEKPMSFSKTPYVITGNASEICELPIADRLDRLAISPLDSAAATSRIQTFLPEDERSSSAPPLLLRHLGGNPFYLGCIGKAMSARKKPEDKDFWKGYIKEIMEGGPALLWSSVLKGFFPGLESRRIALSVSYKIYHTSEPLSCRRIASSCALTEPQAEAVTRTLYLAGIIRGEFGVFRPVEDNVLRDIIDLFYLREIHSRTTHDLEREFLEKLLPQKAEVIRFELVLPMTREAELVAAQCLDQIGKNLHLSQDAIGQLQIAVIEACINAIEHSRGTERRIYVNVVADANRLEVSIESTGQEFIVQETGEPFGDREATKTGGRGWGLKLMKRFADDVRFEKTSRGMKTVLIKHLDKSPRVQKEDAINSE